MENFLARLHAPADLTFRAMFSAIFLVSGAAHVLAPEKISARLVDSANGNLFAFAPAEVLVVLSGIALFAGGIGLLTGTFTRVAAAGLIAVLIPITISIQLGNPEGVGPLFKNVALLGGLVHFLVRGAGAISVDRLIGRSYRLERERLQRATAPAS